MATALKWDVIGKREFETGVSNTALYPINDLGVYEDGVAWSGITSVKVSPDGAEETPMYADNIKYLSLTSAENVKGSVDAFTYPPEFAVNDGSLELIPGVYMSQQERRAFGLVWLTIVGNDTLGNSYGEKLHILYNAKVAPSERSYETINETPNAITFSWAFTTSPVDVSEWSEHLKRPLAYITIDSTKVKKAVYDAIKAIAYGTAATEEPESAAIPAKMPTLDLIMPLIAAEIVTPPVG